MQHFEIALALIWRGDKVLCARRRDDAAHLPGVWEFPGGKREENESLEECACREAREETGLKVLCVRARPAIEHCYDTRIVTLHPFDCRVIGGEERAIECAQLRWIDRRELNAEDFPAANASLIAQLRDEEMLF